MIRYSLRCEDGHDFEGWFSDAAGFDGLRARGLVECTTCGSTAIDRALMAPRVRPARSKAPVPAPAPAAAQPPKAPAAKDPDAMAKAIARMRAEVEKNSVYVGRSFAAEARAIHEGRSERESGSIWGEASPKEARALAEDGIPVMPLPFGPREKQN